MSNPLLSILLPSRSRNGICHAIRFVNKAQELALDKDSYEVILRFDFDDRPCLDRIGDFMHQRNVRVVVGHCFDGYHNLHIFVNDCAALATGRWLGFFNDDAWMTTPHWDQKLLEFEKSHPATSPYVCFAGVDMPAETGAKQMAEFKLGPRYDFPLVSRAAYNAVGCWCPMPVLDWFWFEAFKEMPKLGGEFISDWVLCHEYGRGDRLACCDDELCAKRYRTPAFQTKKREAFERLAKVL